MGEYWKSSTLSTIQSGAIDTQGHYEKIRQNIDRLVVKQGWIQDVAQANPPFQYMNLSNIFEYMSSTQFTEVTPLLMNALDSGGKVAYWNLMVPRKLSDHFPHEFQYCKCESERLTEKDKGFFTLSLTWT